MISVEKLYNRLKEMNVNIKVFIKLYELYIKNTK